MQLKVKGVIASVEHTHRAIFIRIDLSRSNATVDELKTLVGTAISLAVDDNQSRLYT